MQNIDELVNLHECPLCEGGSILEEEGNGFYAQCMDCAAIQFMLIIKTKKIV